MSISRESLLAARKYAQIARAYECHDHQHALAVLIHAYPELLIEVCEVLAAFRFTEAQVKAPGGNESLIPKTFSDHMRPLGWKERRLTAKLVVDEETIFTDTHKIDYVKGRVALDLEWNSKDQTFDRDLYAFRAFFEYKKIAAAVLVTRSDELEKYFKSLGDYVDRYGQRRRYRDKYGASTTHMGKLLPRLSAGRSGGCPVLAVGITMKRRKANDA